MKARRRKLKRMFWQSYTSKWVMYVLILLILIANKTAAQNIIPADTENPVSKKDYKPERDRSFKMTTLTFGGNGLLWTKVNNQSTIMTGGRGSATFNNRYTIGGGGWGMPKGIEIEGSEPGTFDFVKMGYGGFEFGYIILPGEKLNFGTNLLIAGGAIFKESVPESDEKGFKMFPVLEPALYGQISLGNMFRLEAGVSYRYITETNLLYIAGRNLSGFSIHIGLLVKACKCDQ